MINASDAVRRGQALAIEQAVRADLADLDAVPSSEDLAAILKEHADEGLRYLGMVEGLKPTEPITGSAYDMPFQLPRTLAEALRLLRECRPLVDVFGERFVSAYAAVKECEHEAFLQVISAWEREHLLLNV